MQHKLKREGSTVFTRSAHETMVGFYSEMENCIAYGSGLDCFGRQSERETLILWNKSLCNLTKCGLHHFWGRKKHQRKRELWSTCGGQPATFHIHPQWQCLSQIPFRFQETRWSTIHPSHWTLVLFSCFQLGILYEF